MKLSILLPPFHFLKVYGRPNKYKQDQGSIALPLVSAFQLVNQSKWLLLTWGSPPKIKIYKLGLLVGCTGA